MTRSALLRASLAALFGGAIFVASAQLEPPKLDIKKVKDNLFVIEGDGGNTGVFVTDQGAILVDDKFARDVDFILEKVKSVTAQPVRYLLNTHHHGDHTGGNEKMLGQGVEIVAHRNARRNIVERKQPGPGRLSFADEFEISLGGKSVLARHFGRSHTDGDAVVYFPEVKTVHMGDMFVRQAPIIDYSAGGGLLEWIKTIDKVLALDFDTVIPGHGDVCTRADLVAWRKNLADLAARMGQLSRRHEKAEDAVAQLKLEDFGWTSNPVTLKRFEGLHAEMRAAAAK